jgi:hypothetical protein
LQLPELRELATAIQADDAPSQQLARSQQFDRAVRSVVHDVPVPTGLLEQLLASAAQAETAAECPSSDVPVELPACTAAFPGRMKRARFLAILTTVAAVVVLALTIRAYLPTPQKVVTAGELTERVERWLAEALPPDGWRSDLNSAPLGHPLATSIRGEARQWRPLATADDSRAVVYDLTRPGKQRAVLFVVQSPAKYTVAALPPYTKLLASRGMQVVAWQAGEHLYVLAVREGDGQHLDDFLRRPQFTRHPLPLPAPGCEFATINSAI